MDKINKVKTCRSLWFWNDR